MEVTVNTVLAQKSTIFEEKKNLAPLTLALSILFYIYSGGQNY